MCRRGAIGNTTGQAVRLRIGRHRGQAIIKQCEPGTMRLFVLLRNPIRLSRRVAEPLLQGACRVYTACPDDDVPRVARRASQASRVRPGLRACQQLQSAPARIIRFDPHPFKPG
jgi:hypothetical protein